MRTARFRWIILLGLLFLISACASSEVPPIDSAKPVEGEVQTAGPEAVEEMEDTAAVAPEDLFAQNCAGCHAADRSGASGPSLLPERLNKEAGHYAEIISGGSGRMPSFGDKLGQDEINALAEFILTEVE
jgi:mono/diheme cytochrome c family protein